MWEEATATCLQKTLKVSPMSQVLARQWAEVEPCNFKFEGHLHRDDVDVLSTNHWQSTECVLHVVCDLPSRELLQNPAWKKAHWKVSSPLLMTAERAQLAD